MGEEKKTVIALELGQRGHAVPKVNCSVLLSGGEERVRADFATRGKCRGLLIGVKALEGEEDNQNSQVASPMPKKIPIMPREKKKRGENFRRTGEKEGGGRKSRGLSEKKRCREKNFLPYI